MKCKDHPFEHGVGVCASCLRHRLLALIDAASSNPPILSPSPRSSYPSAPPPPLLFPRSVSPYISRHRSVNASPFHRNPPLFFSTPQVGPNFVQYNNNNNKNKNKKSSIISHFFTRSGQLHRSSDINVDDDHSSSYSWFSTLVKRWRLRRRKTRSTDSNNNNNKHNNKKMFRWSRRRSCRREEKPHGSDTEVMGSPTWSDYSTDSFASTAWRIPAPTPSQTRASAAHQAASAFAVWMSPLVRASPQRKSQVVASDVGVSGELRAKFNAGHHRNAWEGRRSATTRRG